MTSNYHSSNNDGKIHVNSYVKKDGTFVREYERGIGSYSSYQNEYQTHFPNLYESYSERNLESKYRNREWEGDVKYDLEKNMIKYIPDDFIYSIGENFAKENNLYDSLELFKVGSVDHGFNNNYVKKNGEMYNSTSELGDEKLAKKIKAQLYLEGTGMDDCRVFDMHENSSLSKKVAQSLEMKELLQKGLPMFRYSGYFPTKQITFETPDLYNTFHRANITDAKFDKDGNLFIKFEDLYNFDKDAKSMRSMAGYKLQEKGKIKPFYIRMTVKIPKMELDKY